MSDGSRPEVGPGWYPDPEGGPGTRWWDGVVWTAPTAPAGGPQAVAMANPVRPELAPGAPIYGALIWVIVLLPLVVWPLTLSYRPKFRIIEVGPSGTPTVDPSSIYTPQYIAVLLASLALYGVSVLLAVADYRRLLRVGVVRPFHWAWSFLSSPVYVIGRSVIVRRVAPGRGLWPVWVLILIEVVGLVLSSISAVGYFQQLTDALQSQT
ncbi:uncharacterized protein DUF2510 [Frondihabitans sp. PhB188]|uniref:DUF2510 domain-containing protein n=1 Tax=Frondihabitans sp. PhB188 TaxID=2485200 RepID=UPI000F4A7296|nr:DUF2510 domain-containing protein [Frondihabitans sp. PhB188]ROQ38370.1 uncharacterized protein DUF2510 [Frondihabitans sp. PhB188]